MIYSISDLLGMHSSIVAHFASQQGLPSPELGNSHHILRRTLSLALDYSYAVRADAVRLLHLLFIFILPKYLFFSFSGLSLSRTANCSIRRRSSLRYLRTFRDNSAYVPINFRKRVTTLLPRLSLDRSSCFHQLFCSFHSASARMINLRLLKLQIAPR